MSVPAQQVAADRDPAPDEPLTELGLARRFRLVHADRLRYVPAWRRWLVYDGARWADDTTGEAHRAAKSLARSLLQHGAATGDKNLIRCAMSAETARGVTAMLALAGTEPGIATSPDEFDVDGYVLNTASGTVDLRTGEVRGHSPADMLSKVTRAGFDPQAPAPTWGAFLARVQPDEAVRAYLRRLFGHAISGTVAEHVLPVLYGVGGNGKSTFVETVIAALGDYAITADPALLIDRGDVHPTGIADLYGRRLAITHETDAGRRLAEGTVKRLTGGDRVKARRMREDFWSFVPSHSVFMITNHRPIVRGVDEGLWRRLRLVPFEVVIAATERDTDLKAKLDAEIDGVLAWLVEGYQEWVRHGLDEPERVLAATADYRADSDALGRFLDEQCVQLPPATVASARLYAAWRNWAGAEGIDPGSQKSFSLALVERGLEPPEKTRTGMVWRGLGLQAVEEPA